MKQPSFFFRQALAIVGLVLFVSVAAQADTIRLKSGRTIKADKVWEENGRVKYQIGESEFSMPKSSVDSIETDAPTADVREVRPAVKSDPSDISGPSGSRKIYFVPLETFPANDLQELVRYCQNRFHIKITVLPPVPIDKAALDRERKQLVSEELNAGMLRALPALAGDLDAVLIGFTNVDMYTRSQNWQFVYGWRGDSGTVAVISTARLELHYRGDANSATLQSRLRKAVLKDIGIMYYSLPQSNDPASVLYSGILGINDLDKVTDRF